MAPGLRGLEIIPFVVAAYNKKLGRMTLFDPANAADFENISGTKMRTMARVRSAVVFLFCSILIPVYLEFLFTGRQKS
jgi:hypothetical protein